MSFTSYLDSLRKLKIKSIEYRRFEFDLITFFKLVIGETTIEIQPIFEIIKLITYWEEKAKKFAEKNADIILIMMLDIILFLTISSNIEQTSKWINFLQKS